MALVAPSQDFTPDEVLAQFQEGQERKLTLLDVYRKYASSKAAVPYTDTFSVFRAGFVVTVLVFLKGNALLL